MISINPINRFLVTSSWHQTEGVVTKSQLTPENFGLLNIYRVKILFDYRIDNRTYHGSRINYGIAANAYLFERFAKVVVDRYPVGKVVIVFYNPENPSDEIVERSPMGGFSVIWIFLTISFFTISIIITARRKEIQATIDRPKVGSLRLRAKSGENVFKDHYPSAVYNPPPQKEKKNNVKLTPYT